MSRPSVSQPKKCPGADPSWANGPLRAQSADTACGSPHVQIPVLARMAMTMMNTIQPIASHAPTLSSPNRLRRPSGP